MSTVDWTKQLTLIEINISPCYVVFFFPEQINEFALTRTGRLKGFLLHIHLLVMEDADPPVYLVEQGGTQIRKLAGGDERVGIEAVVGEELSEVQTLEWEGENMKI